MLRTTSATWVALCSLLLSGPFALADREVGIQFKTPTLGCTVSIDHVWRVGGELWVVSSIPPQLGGFTAIGHARAKVTVDADKEARVRHFVIGKDWNWWKGDRAEFVSSVEDLKARMKKDGKKIDAVLHPVKHTVPDVLNLTMADSDRSRCEVVIDEKGSWGVRRRPFACRSANASPCAMTATVRVVVVSSTRGIRWQGYKATRWPKWAQPRRLRSRRDGMGRDTARPRLKPSDQAPPRYASRSATRAPTRPSPSG